MRNFAIALAALTLSACSDSIEIDPREWTCTEWGEVTEQVPTPAGRTAILISTTTLQCIQWRRMVR